MEEYKIKIEGVSKAFGHGSRKALALLDEGMPREKVLEKTKCAVGAYNVNLSIREGDTFVIMGLSGSGKSTLIRCINLLNRPTRGRIYIDGENIVEYDKDQLREFRRHKVSMVFQHFGLFGHRNVLRNVEYGLEIRGIDKEERREMCLKALESVGLKGWETYYPRQLSGGMKQRVGLARALANEPGILLMDEPFSALDPLIRRDMQTELLDLQDKMEKTIVFITHDMTEAFKMGDRIALMKDGQVVQVGTPEEFMDHPADEYVQSFIEDIDKTRVLKAKNVMHQPDLTWTADEGCRTAVEKMRAHGLSKAFIVDESGKLAGQVLLQDAQTAQDRALGAVMKPVPHTVLRNTYVKELLQDVDQWGSPLAVTDTKGRLAGVINRDDLISGMA